MADKDDTTQQTPKRVLSPREEAMEAIGRTRNDDFHKETGIKIEETDPASIVIDPDLDPEAAAAERERQLLIQAAQKNEPSPDEEQIKLQREQEEVQRAAEAKAAKEAEETTARAQAAAGIDPQGKYKFKVNGEEREFSGADVLRIVQKDSSADERLNEATRILREAREQQEAIARKTEEDAEKARKTGGNPDGVVIDPANLKEFTTALYAGDEAKTTQAFEKAVSSAVAAAMASAKPGRSDATQVVDPVAIAAQVREQIATESALEQSRKDYPELYSDPDVEAVAASRIQRKIAEGVPFVTALGEVQDDFAKKFGWKKAGGTPSAQPRSDRREEKLRQKESLDQPPSGTQAKSATQEEPVATVHDTIREMAKMRGQAV